MRNLIYLSLYLICLGVVCCTKSNEEYIVQGSTTQSRLNGQRVFIVPYGNPTIEDSIGVDSTVIKDGKFEFRSRKGEYLARVTVDKHVRYGTQDLLIVTEPGVITVVIDSVSSGGGTPQNEALQSWKDLKTNRDNVHWNQSQHIKYLREQGDTVYANALADSLKNFNEHYLNQIHGIMRVLGSGTAYNLLHQRYGEPN
ncbi:MAG: DUF4369 domain-containing protein [Muribaculaceae bacterium]|nr:DUF4369 domain-containing protein [Muribaculaceae bacterium]